MTAIARGYYIRFRMHAYGYWGHSIYTAWHKAVQHRHRCIVDRLSVDPQRLLTTKRRCNTHRNAYAIFFDGGLKGRNTGGRAKKQDASFTNDP